VIYFVLSSASLTFSKLSYRLALLDPSRLSYSYLIDKRVFSDAVYASLFNPALSGVLRFIHIYNFACLLLSIACYIMFARSPLAVVSPNLTLPSTPRSMKMSPPLSSPDYRFNSSSSNFAMPLTPPVTPPSPLTTTSTDGTDMRRMRPEFQSRQQQRWEANPLRQTPEVQRLRRRGQFLGRVRQGSEDTRWGARSDQVRRLR